MSDIFNFSAFFEKKEEKKSPPEKKPGKSPMSHIFKMKPKVKKETSDKEKPLNIPEKKFKGEEGRQLTLPLDIPTIKPYTPEEEVGDFDMPYFGPPEEYDFMKKMKKTAKEKKKVKKSDLEKHPFFKYIPADILKLMTKSTDTGTTEDEIAEDDIVYNLDELPIQQGDYVVCNDFEDLNTQQVEFLNNKPMHKVRTVTSKGGSYYSSGEPHIDLGYKIPFKMKRFTKVERDTEGKYKILFLQFDLPIDMHGEKDNHNYFRGQNKMSDLFEVLFMEKMPDAIVDFCQYDDVYRTGKDFYVENLKLRDYDFVFFGFMSNFTTIVKMLISYLDKYAIPYLKYGTFKDLDNKAYEMYLVESLGYPYIPSIMASKITRHVIEKINEWGYPVIVKDVNLNRGEGVWKIENRKELISRFTRGFGSNLMLIQKFIPNDGDYRVISIKNRVELVIKKERIKGSKEFRANVARGGKAVKGSLPSHIIHMCEDISKHLVCDIVGFDIIKDKKSEQYYVMETNSSPHFPTFSVISEINIPGILVDYIIKKITEE
jgi:ribosomal protein S6--L-glutamate ligase